MPQIQWKGLPQAVQRHLMLRAAERGISTQELIRLDAWVRTNPVAPEGEWVKDFGSFKLVGDGAYPKTFLLKGQAARGQRIE